MYPIHRGGRRRSAASISAWSVYVGCVCFLGAWFIGSSGPAASAALAAEPAAQPVPGGPIDIGSRRELFVDRFLIDRLDNTQLRLHEPVSGGVAIRIDKPWEGPANFGMSLLELDGRLLMYYRGWSLTDPADQNGVGCVAESRDGGATWTKPALNLVAKPKWPNNNIIATADGVPRFAFPCAPWVDTRPGVPAAERVKMIQSEPLSGEKHTAMRDPAGPKRLVFWASADGFTFRKLAPQPKMISDLRNCFDGGNTMFWSKVEQQYVLYYRWYDDEWGRGRRSMARATSKDLMTWTPSVPMTYGDTPREQFYVNNTQPYFRAPHIYVAPAARFMEGRQAITAAQAVAIGVKSTGPHVYFKDCSDAVLLTSRAGSTVYDRTFLETFIRPGLGAGNWVSRTNYPLTGILPAGPERIQMFVSRHYMQDSWHIDRLLLRPDGFASVNAPWAGGEMLTKPFTFTGRRLEINYRTGAPGFVRVEVQDAAGTPLPGYALDDCPEIIGDEIARVVAWKAGPDVSRLARRPVRLRFRMKDADLYSLRFTDGDRLQSAQTPRANAAKGFECGKQEYSWPIGWEERAVLRDRRVAASDRMCGGENQKVAQNVASARFPCSPRALLPDARCPPGSGRQVHRLTDAEAAMPLAEHVLDHFGHMDGGQQDQLLVAGYQVRRVGQVQRCLQEKATNISGRQSGQRTRAKPSWSPHFRKAVTLCSTAEHQQAAEQPVDACTPCVAEWAASAATRVRTAGPISAGTVAWVQTTRRVGSGCPNARVRSEPAVQQNQRPASGYSGGSLSAEATCACTIAELCAFGKVDKLLRIAKTSVGRGVPCWRSRRTDSGLGVVLVPTRNS